MASSTAHRESQNVGTGTLWVAGSMIAAARVRVNDAYGYAVAVAGDFTAADDILGAAPGNGLPVSRPVVTAHAQILALATI